MWKKLPYFSGFKLFLISGFLFARRYNGLVFSGVTLERQQLTRGEKKLKIISGRIS